MPSLVISGAHIINPYVGAGTYTLRLIRGLAKSGNADFKVLLPREAEEMVGLLPPHCHVWVEGRSPSRNSLVKNLYWMNRISAMAARDYPEAIFHSPGSFWSLRRPKKLAVTLHDCIYRRFPEYLGHFFVRRWLTYATERYAAKAQLVLTVSHYSANDLQELAGIAASKIKVIYPWIEPRFNPVFATEEAPRVREKYQLPGQFFLYVGGYDYRKNLEFLLSGYAEAKKRGALPPLVLAGKVPTHRAPTLCNVQGAMEKTGLKLGVDILTSGFIADADMPGLYGACQAFIYPSLCEGFGFPPVEAIASGRPVLVADNSSLKEIIGSSKNRFSTDDPTALADLLVAIQHSPSDFLCVPDSRFTEEYAINRYLETLASTFGGDV